MAAETVVFLGDVSDECFALGDIARSFGWSLEMVGDLTQLRSLSWNRDVVAVLFDPGTVAASAGHALQLVRNAAPDALQIVCQRFSDSIPWPDLAAEGAFHALRKPLSPSEFRLSLGFAFDATQAAKNQLI
jgi:DNA-binding NtrC family response regulator